MWVVIAGIIVVWLFLRWRILKGIAVLVKQDMKGKKIKNADQWAKTSINSLQKNKTAMGMVRAFAISNKQMEKQIIKTLQEV